jgi:hypothetical protein
MREYFPLVLLTVVGFTTLCGASSAFIAIKFGPEMSAPLADLQQSLKSLFTAGAGAIIGMLGAGALN